MKLVFLHTSDIHGFLLPTDYQNKKNYQANFSLSRVSSIIKEERAKYGSDHVIVTDAGDCLQGSALASYVHSTKNLVDLKTYTAAYNVVNYDARCLGNHDFNFGMDYLQAYVDQNTAPMLNANVLHQKGEDSAFGQPYKVIEKAGVKIGLIGITTPYIEHWEPEANIAGLKFVSAYEQAKHYAQILRPQVDLLAIVYHGGFEAYIATGEATEPDRGENEGYRIFTQLPQIDLFLTGHQHRRLAWTQGNKAVVQPGYRGEAVGKIVVELDDKTKKIKTVKAELLDAKDYSSDIQIVQLIEPLDRAAQTWLDQPIVHLKNPAPLGNAIKARLTGAPFINLLQQMQLYFTKADISATAVMSETATGFQNDVTLRDIISNYPYANQLCSVRLTGKEIRQTIEFSLTFLQKDESGQVRFIEKYLKPQSLLYNFDVFYPVHYKAEVAKPVGQRLTKLTLNGQPIEDQKTYHVAVNNYRAMGGGFYPSYRADKIDFICDKDYTQMFKEYLQKKDVRIDQVKNYRFL